MRNPSSYTRTYIFLGLFFIILIFAHFVGILKPVEKFFRALVSPVVTSANSWSINIANQMEYLDNPAKIAELISSYNTLSNTVAHKDTQVKILTEENDQLRKLLNFKKETPTTIVISEVIGKEFVSNDQNIIINKGSLAGIKLGDPAIATEGILIGLVIRVENDVSIIRLINDNQSKIGATILNRERSLGVAEGGYGISLRMSMIPREENIAPGDQIITSGMEKTIPRGLLVGTIASVENESYKPFQQAILVPTADLNKLTTVGVLLTN